MPTTRPPVDAITRVEVGLAEWDQAGPESVSGLARNWLADDPRLRTLAASLRGKVDIREGFAGLEISTTSFVGRLDIGPLRISIDPKLKGLPLARLLRYAYGLRDLATLEDTSAPTAHGGLHDLLISLLATEMDELAHRGLARQYVPLSGKLESPRGRILVDQFVREGGLTQARLACCHYERRVDWHLNQVLLAGLGLAERMATDAVLRRRVQRISGFMSGVKQLRGFKLEDVDVAQRSLTRLTAASTAALTLIRLLLDSQGLGFDANDPRTPMRGFLFDMNLFFQRLLSRFLRENLDNARIGDEFSIRGLFSHAPGANPRHRRTPTPRPDIALFRGSHLSAFLDAKYRDLWDRSLPRDWLYQMTIYSLASPSKLSVLLYASMSTQGRDECVQIHHPVAGTAQALGSVIFRPVPLTHLAELLTPGGSFAQAQARRHFAEELVGIRTQTAL